MNRQELLKACLEKIEKYADMVKSEYPGGMPNQILLPALRDAIANPQSEAVELSRLRDENQRFRNGYANLMQALMDAPGLPLEGSSDAALTEWTNIITGILMALGTLDATGKPQSPWEALCAIADTPGRSPRDDIEERK